MTVTLSDKNIAILAANGFDEKHMTAMQRAFTKAKIPHKVIAPEQGLVNGWQDNAWGHYFTVDAPINTALGSDFDALVLVGGERSVDKLKTNPHTRRIINHFLEAGKPIAAIGAGVALLTLSPKSAGRCVAAPIFLQDELKAAKMESSAEDQVTDGLIHSSSGANIDAWVEMALSLFEEMALVEEQAAA